MIHVVGSEGKLEISPNRSALYDLQIMARSADGFCKENSVTLSEDVPA